MKKILVIGGLHGNEPLGIAVVQELQKNPIEGVTAIFGNPAAIAANKRFTESDLNRVFPGNPAGNVEERRASEIMQIAQGFDVVLDFHNTYTPDNDCGFVGGAGYEPFLAIAKNLGLARVIVADYDCVNKYVRGCISVEISLSSDLCNAGIWIERIRALTQGTLAPATSAPDIFRYARKVPIEEQERYGFRDWAAFKPISEKDRDTLQLPPGTYYPIFVDGVYTPETYAGLITPLS